MSQTKRIILVKVKTIANIKETERFSQINRLKGGSVKPNGDSLFCDKPQINSLKRLGLTIHLSRAVGISTPFFTSSRFRFES